MIATLTSVSERSPASAKTERGIDLNLEGIDQPTKIAIDPTANRASENATRIWLSELEAGIIPIRSSHRKSLL